MKKIDIGHVKITHRFRNGVDQTIRLFKKSQKCMIIGEVENRPEDCKITDVLEMYGVHPVVYYQWLKSLTKSEIKHEFHDDTTIVGEKTWIIKIKCGNEERAFKYLKSLTDCFETASTHNLPLDNVYMSNPDVNEELVCTKS